MQEEKGERKGLCVGKLEETASSPAAKDHGNIGGEVGRLQIRDQEGDNCLWLGSFVPPFFKKYWLHRKDSGSRILNQAPATL